MTTDSNWSWLPPYYQDASVTLYQGDALKVLPGIAADVAMLDLPYNAGKIYGADPKADELPEVEYGAWVREVLHLTQQAAPTVLWFPGTRNFLSAQDWAAHSGLLVHRVLGWHKKEFAGDKFGAGPAMCWEPILWMTRAGSEKRWNKLFGTWGRDFLVVNSTHGSPYGHPCPKPIEVMRWLVALFVPEGGSVLDPTAGIGTTLRAAKDLNRLGVGIELEERWCEVAVERLAQESMSIGGAV